MKCPICKEENVGFSHVLSEIFIILGYLFFGSILMMIMYGAAY